VILTVVLIGCVAMSTATRFGQSVSFHQFADTRSWLGVPNFLDVVTNALFAEL
jgi:hypothetical protein